MDQQLPEQYGRHNEVRNIDIEKDELVLGAVLCSDQFGQDREHCGDCLRGCGVLKSEKII